MKEVGLGSGIVVSGVLFPAFAGHLLTILVLCISLDFITGVRASGERLSSRKMNATVNKLLAYLSLTLVSGTIEIMTLNLTKTATPPLLMMTLAFLNSREIWSILENTNKLGVKLPNFLAKHLPKEEE